MFSEPDHRAAVEFDVVMERWKEKKRKNFEGCHVDYVRPPVTTGREKKPCTRLLTTPWIATVEPSLAQPNEVLVRVRDGSRTSAHHMYWACTQTVGSPLFQIIHPGL